MCLRRLLAQAGAGRPPRSTAGNKRSYGGSRSSATSPSEQRPAPRSHKKGHGIKSIDLTSVINLPPELEQLDPVSPDEVSHETHATLPIAVCSQTTLANPSACR